MTDEANLALLLVRVVVGVSMAAHGWNKATSLEGTAGWFDSIGMRPGRIHARLAAGGEILAGLFLAVGLLTSFASLGFVGLMTVAWYTSHRSAGFFIIKAGWEYVMVLAVIAITIAMLGPGEWSLDSAIGIAADLDGYVGLAISAGGGTLAAAALLALCFRPPPASTN
ncbi:MAG: DoxX family protein [Ilumatobacter sp.]|uniref:DoxX family protein n=1 Tax=Ilumatobacter sp. TaxID=1967498 RepID=UPI003298619A